MTQHATLLLRLEGPLQSWGYRSRFVNRDTGLEPTKSGVIGLLCCALGRDRAAAPNDLAKLKMHIRVDRPGTLLTDFQTAGGGVFRGSKKYFPPTSDGGKRKAPVVMEKQYLSDASFTVALEGEASLLQDLASALQDPVWPLSLGRKSCPPSTPVFLSLVQQPSATVLPTAPYTDRIAAKPKFIWETDKPSDETEMRNDVPISWSNHLDRNYTVRFIKTEIREWER